MLSRTDLYDPPARIWNVKRDPRRQWLKALVCQSFIACVPTQSIAAEGTAQNKKSRYPFFIGLAVLQLLIHKLDQGSNVGFRKVEFNAGSIVNGR